VGFLTFRAKPILSEAKLLSVTTAIVTQIFIGVLDPGFAL
jgi:hypothetical protein